MPCRSVDGCWAFILPVYQFVIVVVSCDLPFTRSFCLFTSRLLQLHLLSSSIFCVYLHPLSLPILRPAQNLSRSFPPRPSSPATFSDLLWHTALASLHAPTRRLPRTFLRFYVLLLGFLVTAFRPQAFCFFCLFSRRHIFSTFSFISPLLIHIEFLSFSPSLSISPSLALSLSVRLRIYAQGTLLPRQKQ